MITTIFTDVGGVLLTNGWDRKARAAAADKFKLDSAEMDERHHLTFDTYEEGKLSLDEYLDRLVFYEERSFSRSDFKQFMLNASQPFPDMLRLMQQLKNKYGVRIAVINNEGQELNEYRIHTFQLTQFVDFFISSSFVHFRKPDKDIFKLALNVSQANVDQSIYIDDRKMFVEVAEAVGLKGVHHQSYNQTRDALAALGLEL